MSTQSTQQIETVNPVTSNFALRQPTLRSPWISLIFVFGLILASCTSTSPISDPEETVSPPETADLSKQQATTSTTADSTTTESAAAEPTMEEAVAEIEDFMQTVRVTWHECVSIPQDCGARQELSQIFEGDKLRFTVEQVEKKALDGLESKPPVEAKHDQYIVEDIEISEATSDTAIVYYCIIDGFIVVDPGAAPDGTDLIVNDIVGSVRREAILVRKGDMGWRIEATDDVKRFEGGEGCNE